jgi:hypothetical protein
MEATWKHHGNPNFVSSWKHHGRSKTEKQQKY